MTWKTVNIKLKKGSIFAVYGDSAPFFQSFLTTDVQMEKFHR